MNDKKRSVGRPKSANPASKGVLIRASEEQKAEWIAAAFRDGFIKAGKGNVSAWIKDLADKRAATNKAGE